jgi:N-methylhydantoinase B
MGEILDQGERAARRALSALPSGEYFAEEMMDDDGLSEEPIPVRVNVTIESDCFVADFTGSAPQVRGPVNCTRTRLNSACRSIFKAVTEPGDHLNDGWFRPLEVVCPEGTVFTATRPAPVSTYWETGAYAVDLLWKALFPALPGRLTAGHFLSICGTIVSGKAEDGRETELSATDRQNGRSASGQETDRSAAARAVGSGPFILVEPQAGGWGAGAGKDGESGLVAVGDGETYMVPVEVCESRYPLLVERYAFAVTESGAGRFRGGFGLRRDYRLLCDEGSLTATFGRHRFLPWGAEGGDDGSPNGVAVFREGKTIVWKGKLARFPLKRGDVVRLVTGTGGGFGAPSERDPDLVRTDVLNGFCSLERARDVFGVELDPCSFEIDREKTEARHGYGNL